LRKLLPRGFGTIGLTVVFCFGTCSARGDVSGLTKSKHIAIDIGVHGSPVQPGWIAWAVSAGKHWNRRGPFRLALGGTSFDPDGFQVELGPDEGLGFRSGPPCTGGYASVITENLFSWSDRPMTVALSGLAAGRYRVITWHNDSRGYVRPDLALLVTDAAGADREAVAAHPQTGAADSAQASRVAFEVESDGLADIVITARVPVADHVYVSLNGIEITPVSHASAAFHPVPAIGTDDLPHNVTVSWEAPAKVKAFHVYTGPDADALRLVARNVTGRSYRLESLPFSRTSHWCVESVTGAGIVRSDVWNFRVRDGATSFPWPWDGAKEVRLPALLSWAGVPGADSYRLYIGDSPESLVRVETEEADGEWLAENLSLATTYHWRVDSVHGHDIVPGKLWRFTTASGRAREPGPVRFARRIPLETNLLWSPGAQGASHTVLLGTSPESLTVRAHDLAPSRFPIGPLARGRRYYWRIDETYGEQTVTGETWAFTTVGAKDTDGLETDDILKIAGVKVGPRATQLDTSEIEADAQEELHCDVCVVGGGSGGIGAAVAAARAGVSVILVEREDRLGGTSTSGGVSSWEPGPGCAIAREIVERLQRIPGGVSPNVVYEKTLTRAMGRGVPYDPEVFSKVVTAMLSETGRCRVMLQTSFVAASVDRVGGRVDSIRAVSDSGGTYPIRAGVFIDSTGGGYLCQAAGCETMLGAEPREHFNEPSAPENPAEILNALEIIYRIRRAESPTPQALPEGMAARRGGYACGLPNGDRFVNSCGGLMPGWKLLALGYDGAMAEAKRRALAHWHTMQKTRYKEFEFDRFSPMLAIRESYRIAGEYVLTERDLAINVSERKHPDIIAIADHPMDTHGSGGGLSEVATPYGIPYRCLVPKGGWRNLLVACRGASFSHLAASSCRLQRTMIQIGHAAGLAAAQAVHCRRDVDQVDVVQLQEQLGLPSRSATDCRNGR
jgi:hypothetical protein